MESKYLNFLLDENEINRIANEVGLCKRIRKFTPLELLKMVTFSPNNIAKDILTDISLNLFEESGVSSGKCGFTTLSIFSDFSY